MSFQDLSKNILEAPKPKGSKNFIKNGEEAAIVGIT